MGDIEENAIPILTPLVLGRSVQISHTSRITLAEWLTLKFLIVDSDRDNTPIATQSLRTAFMKHRKIPRGLKIWIAHHNAFEWSAGAWGRGLTMSFTPKKPHGRLRNNVKTLAFGAGHVFSLTFLSLIEEIDLEIDNPFTPKLWPSDVSAINWPPPLIPFNGIGALANVMDEFEARPDVTWGSP